MGGYAQPRCETALWRGHRVCKHSVPKLDAWAKGSGSAFFVQPIQGCYSSSLAASAGTHDGGGVYDVECDGYSLRVANDAVNAGRKVLLVTFGRWWNGNHHIHLIDPECPDLAPAAEEQMEQFRRGETGLVGVDLDPWDRSTVDAIFRVYDSRHDVKTAPVGAHRTYTIQKGGTLGAAAIALGVTVGALAGWNHIDNPNVVRPGQVVTAPPSGYTAPAPAPAQPAPSGHAPAPAKPKPAPAAPPASSSPSSGFRPIPGQMSVYPSLLKAGQTNSTSVYLYERALARRGWLSPAYVDGFYGTATSAATLHAYRSLGVSPVGTTPGPYLLRVLGLPTAGSSAASAPAVSASGFRPIASQRGVYTPLLKEGKSNSTSVYRYEQALARAGYLAPRYASDGYYGTATSAATRSAYRDLGVTPNATRPGPYLLKHLGVGVIG